MFDISRHLLNEYIATYDCYYELKQKHQMPEYYITLLDWNTLILLKVMETS